MHSQYYSGHNPRSAGVYYQATHTTSLFGSTGLKRKRSQDDRPEDTSPQAEQKVAKRLKAGEMMPQRNWEEENERHLSYSWLEKGKWRAPVLPTMDIITAAEQLTAVPKLLPSFREQNSSLVPIQSKLSAFLNNTLQSPRYNRYMPKAYLGWQWKEALHKIASLG